MYMVFTILRSSYRKYSYSNFIFCFKFIFGYCLRQSPLLFNRSFLEVITYGNHVNFRPTHFSSYGNLKVIFETTFQQLFFSSFIFTSFNIYYS